MIAMRNSFAGETPILAALSSEYEQQDELMRQMDRDAAQVKAAPYGIALPALPSSVPDTRSLWDSIGSTISGLGGAFVKQAEYNKAKGKGA